MSKATDRQKIQDQAGQLVKARNQIQALVGQNAELKGALVDKHVNELRRQYAFQALNAFVGTEFGAKLLAKPGKFAAMLPRFIEHADAMIETLKASAEPLPTDEGVVQDRLVTRVNEQSGLLDRTTALLEFFIKQGGDALTSPPDGEDAEVEWYGKFKSLALDLGIDFPEAKDKAGAVET